jgi:predicted deacylase
MRINRAVWPLLIFLLIAGYILLANPGDHVIIADLPASQNTATPPLDAPIVDLDRPPKTATYPPLTTEANTVTLEILVPSPEVTLMPSLTPTSVLDSNHDRPQNTSTPEPGKSTIIGRSADGRPIFNYQVGRGQDNVVIVGGVHGGYEWNTILLAYQVWDYFLANPEYVPPSVTLHVIPNANPDGLYAVSFKIGRFTAADVISDTFPGRFNGNGVDINRNWDCQWQPIAIWRDEPISGGDSPFSEPESQSLRDFFLDLRPAVVLFLHSAAEGVYAAGCPETDDHSYHLATLYGTAAGYPIYDHFQHYEITGDAGDWLVTQGIPSITVELTNHEELDWSQNLVGILALFDYYRALPSFPRP